MSRIPRAGLATLAIGGLALAGCGTSSAKAPGAASNASPSTGSAATTVEVRSTALGQVLTTASGKVLYLLTADRPGSRSCSGACLQYWPPVMLHGAAVGAPGVTAHLGQLAVSGGEQLTVNGQPAYTYSGDTIAGQTSGQGIGSFGGVWWVMSTSGAAITNSTHSTAPTSASGYSGY
ncbi:MAG: hypothetical protein M0Z30_08000 [Actinomycetota bacterium]|nr:hypothetical protein [Actinomycetota bacterium]